MRTAIVVYRSQTGTTRAFAEAIGDHVRARGLAATVVSVGDCDPSTLEGADVVLLGCWTGGFMIVAQGPDQPWRMFVRRMPAIRHARVGLFTTYKLATGSMFPRMRRELGDKVEAIGLELKSRTDRLTPSHRLDLDRFLDAP